MCHNILTSYVYPYIMYVSSVQAPQVDSINLTPLEMCLTSTEHPSANR